MVHKEFKYKVGSFESILSILEKVGARAGTRSVTYHYYARLDSEDVIKLVVYEDRSEIHKLDEKDGSFELTDRISVDDKQAGLRWLKDHGYEDLQEVKMDSVDYDYSGGRVGLYTINNDLLSVILDFPESSFMEMAELFELSEQDRIFQPYNKYVEL